MTTRCLAVLLAVLAETGFAAAGVAVRVRLADGREIAGDLAALNASNVVVRGAEGLKSLPAGDVAAVVFPNPRTGDTLAIKGQWVVQGGNGSHVGVRDLTVRGGSLEAEAMAGFRVDARLSGVTRLLFPASAETPDELSERARRLPPAAVGHDALVARAADGRLLPMDGILESIGGGRVGFRYEGAETAMDLARIALIVFAAAGGTNAPPPAGHVTATDGSRLAFRRLDLQGQELIVDGASLGVVRLTADRIADVRFVNRRIAWLSDLTPTVAVETPYFDDAFPWQRDRSLEGQPLRVGGAKYEKGLALHAQCRLTFDLQGRYRRLTAVAGIDDDVRAGAAKLTLLADGKTLTGPLLLARDQRPAPLALDLAGARELVILVDFAEGTMGSGARVNLCNAELLPAEAGTPQGPPADPLPGDVRRRPAPDQ